jgi:hypothetical protein
MVPEIVVANGWSVCKIKSGQGNACPASDDLKPNKTNNKGNGQGRYGERI